MSRILDIGGRLIASDKIISIKTYEDDVRVPVKLTAWDEFLCIFRKQMHDGKPVHHSILYGSHIITGTRTMMIVKTVDGDWFHEEADGAVIGQWMEAVERR